MNEFENSSVVCVYLYTYPYSDLKKTEIQESTFDHATIIYEEDSKQFDNWKKNGITLEEENGAITGVFICMRYDIARQFLHKVNFRCMVSCDWSEEDCKEDGREASYVYHEYWDCIYPKRKYLEFYNRKNKEARHDLPS